jgi:hypothetical protein
MKQLRSVVRTSAQRPHAVLDAECGSRLSNTAYDRTRRAAYASAAHKPTRRVGSGPYNRTYEVLARLMRGRRLHRLPRWAVRLGASQGAVCTTQLDGIRRHTYRVAQDEDASDDRHGGNRAAGVDECGVDVVGGYADEQARRHAGGGLVRRHRTECVHKLFGYWPCEFRQSLLGRCGSNVPLSGTPPKRISGRSP